MNRPLSTTLLALSLVACGDNTDDGSEEIAQLEDMIADLQDRYAQLQAQLETRTQERDALAGEVAELESKFTPTVTLAVPLKYGTAALALGTEYPLSGGGTISFREVRYWLTNVALQKTDDEWVAIADAYYLVEARGEQPLTNGTAAAITLPANRRESITLRGLPAGDYKAIKFNVGVDAAHNDDLSKTAGELHTLRNMAFVNWMWFTSYVFTKTVADLSGGTPDAEVSWDNGTNADLREVTLPFPSTQMLAANHTYAITVDANLEDLVSEVDPTTRDVINATTPDDRTVLADAFADMFSMVSVAPVP